jgi:hypothetical protein
MLPDHLQRFEISCLTGTEGRCRVEPQDPRVAQLDRLRLSLARAAKRIDEFEMRLERAIGAGRISIRNPMAGENNFANHVAAGLKKARLPNGELRS